MPQLTMTRRSANNSAKKFAKSEANGGKRKAQKQMERMTCVYQLNSCGV